MKYIKLFKEKYNSPTLISDLKKSIKLDDVVNRLDDYPQYYKYIYDWGYDENQIIFFKVYSHTPQYVIEDIKENFPGVEIKK